MVDKSSDTETMFSIGKHTHSQYRQKWSPSYGSNCRSGKVSRPELTAWIIVSRTGRTSKITEIVLATNSKLQEHKRYAKGPVRKLTENKQSLQYHTEHKEHLQRRCGSDSPSLTKRVTNPSFIRAVRAIFRTEEVFTHVTTNTKKSAKIAELRVAMGPAVAISSGTSRYYRQWTYN